MYQDKYIFLLVAPSGSGKDTVANKLCEDYGFTKVRSYTTRPRRVNDNTDTHNHLFITEEVYQNIISTQQVVATTIFSDYHYCATQEQINNNDLYIVDICGIETLKHNYIGTKQVKVIGIECSLDDREERMLKRGDNVNQVCRRLAHDVRAFYGWNNHLDICFTNNNNELENCCKQIKSYVDKLLECEE